MAVRKKTSSYNFPSPGDNPHLVGHSQILKTFNDAWARRDEYPIHPVWLLSGARGIGKATLAHQIAKKVYGNVGDFFIIDMDHNIDKDGKPKTDGKVISVYTVRAMIEKMQMSAMSGEWRVILIDSVDELNAQASNAMLKLLEEPPEKTLFLLVVHQLGRTLPTIRSRARVEKLRPLTITELRELCIKFIPDEEISTAMLRLANGSFGKIADLKNSGGDEIYESLLELLQNPRANSADAMAIARKIAPAPELHGILLDAIAHFGLADLYPAAAQSLNNIATVYLEPEIGIFKIISDIKKCL
ncbi:MAG: AAA family ATPase [Rickettsiales bacterium]|jgi:DNA polymerase-3 subunit delta'|nr:AAA family ATPase [Rickettsiales bacterium]